MGLDALRPGVRVLGTLSRQWIPGEQLHRDARSWRWPTGVPCSCAQPTEVAAILEAAAGRVPARRRSCSRWSAQIRGWDLRYAAYPVEGLKVWGMTARVLGGLGAWLARDSG